MYIITNSLIAYMGVICDIAQLCIMHLQNEEKWEKLFYLGCNSACSSES